MCAVVLAGGLGTRLQGVVNDLPKVLAPVHGRPFLTYVLDRLVDAGVGCAILAVGYMADAVERAIGDCYCGMVVRYSREATPLGTGGALCQALEQVDGDTLLVLNGDSYCAVDLELLLRFHRAGHELGTVALTAVADGSSYGSADVDATGVVTAFHERHRDHSPALLNAGVYVLERAALTAFPGGIISLERDVFPRLAERAELRGLHVQAPLLDIGTPASYAQAEARLTKVTARRPFVCLDRDGTVIEYEPYLTQATRVRLIEGAANAIRALRDAGYGVFVITNQSAIARGHGTRRAVSAVHEEICRQLRVQGAYLDGIYFCPHLPEARCACRKPAAQLVWSAARTHACSAERCVAVIGDSVSDMRLAARCGALGLQVESGLGAQQPVPPGAMRFTDIRSAAAWLISRFPTTSSSLPSAKTRDS